ncbi:MAG: hypothetical protein HYV40_02190 [Candidatus Levybacteria bacterium]|nr:hypothetical protein [Candidatus Levybacteria bacterium]
MSSQEFPPVSSETRIVREPTVEENLATVAGLTSDVDNVEAEDIIDPIALVAGFPSRVDNITEQLGPTAVLGRHEYHLANGGPIVTIEHHYILEIDGFNYPVTEDFTAMVGPHQSIQDDPTSLRYSFAGNTLPLDPTLCAENMHAILTTIEMQMPYLIQNRQPAEEIPSAA